MANRRSIVSLQQLPFEVLTKIVQKVVKASSADYCNLKATCKIMKESSNSPEVLHSQCLLPLVKKPRRALQHSDILDKCIEHENCAAFFRSRYSHLLLRGGEENRMAYLKNAAIGEGDDDILEAAYLYGVLRFLYGDPLRVPFDEMAFKNWREDEEDFVGPSLEEVEQDTAWNHCPKKQVYVRLMKNSKPDRSCHVLDMEIDYPDCFMYKRGLKLFYMKFIVAPDQGV